MVILNGGMATRFGGVVKGVVEVFDGMSFRKYKNFCYEFIFNSRKDEAAF